MANKTNVSALGERELLERILSKIERQERMSKADTLAQSNVVYDNKSLMLLLGIKDKYLKKLRDNGYLGYSREGDKYWYTQEDVNRFLHRFHCEDFAAANNLPEQKGNIHG